MTSAQTAAAVVLMLVIFQRLAELVIAQRNTKALLMAGGTEVGGRHYPAIVAIHAAWIVGLAVWIAQRSVVISGLWLAVYAALQVARIWVMVSLGRFWTTRIIVVSGAPLIKRGPYRYIRHPNYFVVAGEIAALPLAFGATRLALAFTLINGAVLAYRIAIENRTLKLRAASSTAEPAATTQPGRQSAATPR